MKKTILSKVLLCSILLSSCEGNDDGSLIGNQPNNNKLIKKVTIQNPDYPDYYNPDKFIYENGKIIKTWFYGQSGALSEFEYGVNGKISNVYRKGGVSYSDIGTSIKDTEVVTKHIYDMEGNLISITDNTGKVLCSIDYDSNGRLYKVDIKDFDFGKPYTYIYSDFDENGNPKKVNYGATISYDNEVNPVYILFKKFGFYNVEMGNSLDGSLSGLYFSPNNIKEITDTNNSNEIFFSAIYSYDSDGYPISSSYNVSRGDTKYGNVDIYEY